MKANDLLKIGFKQGSVIGCALKECEKAVSAGWEEAHVRQHLKKLVENPEAYDSHEFFAGTAKIWHEILNPPVVEYQLIDKPFASWGEKGIDDNTRAQMQSAMRLPISVAGALMPDAHLGYGLPVGGVLATRGAVIPFAVGVDIACRMRLSVLPIEVQTGNKHNEIDKREDQFSRAITQNTRFGVGGAWNKGERPEHPVLDEDWNITSITGRVKEKALEQLGTSGSGNHFCDLGEMEFSEDFTHPDDPTVVVPKGRYVAILTHSGSRGPGAQVAAFYSKLAESLHPDLPPEYKRLAWLDMDGAGAEYWAAMELMGRFAAANHECIHKKISKFLKVKPLLSVENHHNFAWKETYNGEELIVHRKGATPAGHNVLGIIPGTMASPAYLVSGSQGDKASSLNSASHGAGRAMSRTKTKETYRWSHVKAFLAERRVKVLAAGLDEVPGGYKNIEEVMAAQKDLVDVRGIFYPRIVRMSDDGTAED